MNAPELRHLLSWRDHSDDFWQQCIESARRHFGARNERMQLRRSLALIFFNPSLRTRTSMEVAAAHLGAHATTLIPGSGTWQFEWRRGEVMDGDRAEHISEAIGVLSPLLRTRWACACSPAAQTMRRTGTRRCSALFCRPQRCPSSTWNPLLPPVPGTRRCLHASGAFWRPGQGQEVRPGLVLPPEGAAPGGAPLGAAHGCQAGNGRDGGPPGGALASTPV